MKKYIITIGREFGSGGKTIAVKLSERLGIPYYDRDLVALAAEKRDISPDVVAEADENIPQPWEYNTLGLPLFPERIFKSQSEIIREIADKDESCIFVGRCADYILRERDDIVTVYLHASPECRIERTKQQHDLTYEAAKAMVKKTDKTRKAYYQYFTDRRWGREDHHAVILDTGVLGIDTCVDAIAAIVQARFAD